MAEGTSRFSRGSTDGRQRGGIGLAPLRALPGLVGVLTRERRSRNHWFVIGHLPRDPVRGRGARHRKEPGKYSNGREGAGRKWGLACRTVEGLVAPAEER